MLMKPHIFQTWYKIQHSLTRHHFSIPLNHLAFAPFLPLCPSSRLSLPNHSLTLPHHKSTNMAGGKKLIASCHQHKWYNKKGCHYRPKLQPIPEDGEFKPRGLILVKLPSQCQHQATESKKTKHDTILSTFSEKCRYAKINKLFDAWIQQVPWQHEEYQPRSSMASNVSKQSCGPPMI
jgi:hypothetical protein